MAKKNRRYEIVAFHQIGKQKEFHFLDGDGEPNAPLYIVPLDDGDCDVVCSLVGTLDNPQWIELLPVDAIDANAPCAIVRQPIFSELQYGDYFVFTDAPQDAPPMWIDHDELWCIDNRPVFPARHIRPDAPIRHVDDPILCDICETCWNNRPDEMRHHAGPDDLRGACNV